MTALIALDQPFRLDQLPMLGIAPAAFARLRRDGEYRRVLRGVYVQRRCAGQSIGTYGRDTTRPATPRCPDGLLCGLGDGRGHVRARGPLRPHAGLDGAPRRDPLGTPGVRFVEGYLAPEDVILLDDLPVTAPTRTASDLLRRLRRPLSLAAADGLAHAGLTTPAEIQAYLDPLRGYPGIVQARELVRLVEPDAESGGESILRLRLVDAGLGRPKPQYLVEDLTGRIVARADLAYVAQRVICEHDGSEFHSHDDDRDRDVRRRAYLSEVLEWRVVVSTKETLFGTDNAVEREVGAYLGVRATASPVVTRETHGWARPNSRMGGYWVTR